MKTVLLFICILKASIVSAQTLDWRYSDNIYMGVLKDQLIEVVVNKANGYYMSDINGIIKKMKKKKNVKLNKLENRIDFLSEMEIDIRNKLKVSNAWWNIEDIIYDDYLISIKELLGDDINIPGLGKPNTGTNGKATVSVGFTNNRLSSINAVMSTIRNYNYNITNGLPYTAAHLADVSRVIKHNFGDYSLDRSHHLNYMCSQKGEPVYREKFNFRGQGIAGYIILEYGPYIQQIDKYTCRYISNQMTSIVLDFKKVN